MAITQFILIILLNCSIIIIGITNNLQNKEIKSLHSQISSNLSDIYILEHKMDILEKKLCSDAGFVACGNIYNNIKNK